MAILFQCPCGRSMVAESDKAGSVVRCPNCSRSLRIPTGKGRGKEIASAPAVPTTRLCTRCKHPVPIDAQQCPHCKVILMDDAAPAAAAATALAVGGRRPALRTAASPILYGGARGTWFSRLSDGGMAAVILGFFGVLALSAITITLLYFSWSRKQLETGRTMAEAKIREGKALELQGLFQDAYDGYRSALYYAEFLRATKIESDQDFVNWLEGRQQVLKYIVPEPKVPAEEEPLLWKAKSREELDDAITNNLKGYQSYRQLILGVRQAGLLAVEAAKASNRPDFEAKLALTLEAFFQFIGKISPQQRATYSFDILSAAVRDLTSIEHLWDKDRDTHILASESRLDAVKEMVDTPDRDTLRPSS